MLGKKFFNKQKDKDEFVANSDIQDKYNEKRRIWVWTTILCAIFPFVIQIISAISNHNFNFLSIVNNGDIILLSYSIVIPTYIDVLKVKNKISPEYIIGAIIFTLVIFSDVYIYSTIKNPPKYLNEQNELIEYDNTIQNSIYSIVMFFSSIIVCGRMMKITYECDFDDREVQEQMNGKRGKK